MTLGQRHHAVRQRDPAADLWQGRPAARFLRAVEPNQFRGPTADIKQHRAVSLRIDQWRAAGGGEARLGLAIDDFKLEAHFLRDAGTKVLAVLRRTAGFGGDQTGAGDALVLHLVAADRERGHGALDRRLAYAAGRRDALAEPDDAGESINDAKPSAVGRAT